MEGNRDNYEDKSSYNQRGRGGNSGNRGNRGGYRGGYRGNGEYRPKPKRVVQSPDHNSNEFIVVVNNNFEESKPRKQYVPKRMVIITEDEVHDQNNNNNIVNNSNINYSKNNVSNNRKQQRKNSNSANSTPNLPDSTPPTNNNNNQNSRNRNNNNSRKNQSSPDNIVSIDVNNNRNNIRYNQRNNNNRNSGSNGDNGGNSSNENKINNSEMQSSEKRYNNRRNRKDNKNTKDETTSSDNNDNNKGNSNSNRNVRKNTNDKSQIEKRNDDNKNKNNSQKQQQKEEKKNGGDDNNKNGGNKQTKGKDRRRRGREKRPYLTEEEVEKGLESGDLKLGIYKSNPQSFHIAYVTVEGEPKDIAIHGSDHQNCALNGDVVVIRIRKPSPSEEKKKKKSSSSSQPLINKSESKKVEEGEEDNILSQILNDSQEIDLDTTDEDVKNKSLDITVDDDDDDDDDEEDEIEEAEFEALLQEEEEGGDKLPSKEIPRKKGEVVFIKERKTTTVVGYFDPPADLVQPGKINSSKLNGRFMLQFKSLNDKLPPFVVQREGRTWLSSIFSLDQFSKEQRELKEGRSKSNQNGYIRTYVDYICEKLTTHLFELEFTGWDQKNGFPGGKIVKCFGKASERTTNLNMIKSLCGIQHSEVFSDEVMAEVSAFENWVIPNEEIANRIDLRGVKIFSIDPPTTKDIDDALSCELLENGMYRIGVHIADLSYFIRLGSELDKEALRRSTTVYFVANNIPMIPRLLSEYCCSLVEGVDRLAFSVFWTMTEDAEIVDTKICKSVIKNYAKLDYASAYQVQIAPEEFAADSKQMLCRSEIVQLQSLADKMKKRREENDAVKMLSFKLYFELDDQGDPIRYHQYQLKKTNSMIEEFMLQANRSVAEHLFAKYPSHTLLRRHDQPNFLRVSNFDKKMSFLQPHFSSPLFSDLISLSNSIQLAADAARDDDDNDNNNDKKNCGSGDDGGVAAIAAAIGELQISSENDIVIGGDPNAKKKKNDIPRFLPSHFVNFTSQLESHLRNNNNNHHQQNENENEKLNAQNMISSPSNEMIEKYKEVLYQGIMYVVSKTMVIAKYAVTAQDDIAEFHHFALNFSLYTHFTSPIRRYADLVVHRLLYDAILDVPVSKICYPEPDEIFHISEICNTNNTTSKRAQLKCDELYFAILLKKNHITIDATAVIIDISNSYFDVYFVDLGFDKRISYRDLKGVSSFSSSPPFSVSFTWSDDPLSDQQNDDKKNNNNSKNKNNNNKNNNNNSKNKENNNKSANEKKNEEEGVNVTKKSFELFSIITMNLADNSSSVVPKFVATLPLHLNQNELNVASILKNNNKG